MKDDDVGLELVAFGVDLVELSVEFRVSGGEVFVLGLRCLREREKS